MSDRGKKRRKKRTPFDLGPFDEMFEKVWEDLMEMLD